MDYVKAKAHTTVPKADVAWNETVEPGEVIRLADLPAWFQKLVTEDPWTRELFEPATAEEFTAWIGDVEDEEEAAPMPMVAARQQAVAKAAEEQKAREALGRGRRKAEPAGAAQE